MGDKADSGRSSRGGQTAPTAASEEAADGCYPSSLHSPMSSCGGGAGGASGGAAFEPNCSLDKFMEVFGNPLSPDGQQWHLDKRQSIESNSSMTPFGGSRGRRCSNGSYTGGAAAAAAPGSSSRATPNLRLRRTSAGGDSTVSRMSIGSASCISESGDGSGHDGGGGGTADSSSTRAKIPRSSSAASSPGLQTPRSGTARHGHFTRVRRNSPVKLDPSSPPPAAASAGSGRGRAGGRGTPASGSRSPKRKRNYSQLTNFGDENGAPSPFPRDGTSKTASRVLSNSSLTVHKDGAYMQVTFDETHRFATEEDPPMNPLGEALMNDPFLATPEPMGNRRDIDQALSLLQLSGGSGSSKSDLTRSARRSSGGPGTGGKGTPGPAGALFPPLNPQESVENVVPGSSSAGASATSLAATSAPSRGSAAATIASWGAKPPMGVHGHMAHLSGTSSQLPPPPQSPFSTAAAAAAAAGYHNNAASAASARRVLPHPPPDPTVGNGAAGGKKAGSRGAGGGGSGGGVKGPAGDARGQSSGSGGGGGVSGGAATAAAAAAAGMRGKGKMKAKGAVGGQRPAVQAPVSTPRGTKGGGPGSFCSKPEALSQLDTSQSDLMVLDADLWIVRERGDHCSSNECIYKDKASGISSRRHYHATCDHRHKGGPKGGMIFHHHQLEKIQKHQRAHIRILHKKTPAEAVLNEGNVEPYLPHEWSEQEASVLAHLVGMYGPTNWGIIAAGVATKSETQCMLHWRYALNGNATVKGTGTWQSVEDERMLSLVQIFGQRWSTVAEHMPGRLAKQCRERYLNNLDPELRRGAWSREEDEKLLQLRGQQNKSFAKIAEQIDGRSYNDVKNRWSQISRQIAALKKASHTNGDGPVPGPLAPHAPSEHDVARLATGGLQHRAAGAAGVADTAGSKWPVARQNSSSGSGGGGGGGGSSSITRSGGRRAAAGTAAEAAGAGAGVADVGDAGGPAKSTTRYKVCLQGGIPTLLEAEGADDGVGGGDANREACTAPAPGSARGSASSGPSFPAEARAAKDEPVRSPFRGYPVQQQKQLPQRGETSTRAGPAGGGGAGSSSPSDSSAPYGVFMGDGGVVGEAAAAAAAAADLGPQMTEAEATSIAGGALFGFGNDMRVSI